MTRDRGTYGPLDRDRNWVVGWTADQTVDYARERAVGAVLRPVVPVAEDVFKASRGARRVWTAARGLDARNGERPATQIGQDLFHTVGDRDRAIEQISTGFRALASDLALWQSTHANRPDAKKTALWLATDVTPTLEEWAAFVEREKPSWWTKVATSWETFEGWWERLRQLRSQARLHGVALQSAEPVALPKTIWQQSDSGNGSEATAILGVLKIGAFTALGVMGIAGLFSAMSSLRERAVASSERDQLRGIVREELARRRP